MQHQCSPALPRVLLAFAAWNYEGENLLRACDELEYTIVRPGIMRGEEADLPPNALTLADDGGDLKVSSIPHASIARLCVDCLAFENTGRSTLCAMTVADGSGASDWNSLLPTVAADRRAFRDDLFQEHQRAVAIGGSAISALLLGLALSAAALLKAVLGAIAKLLLR